VRLSGHGAAINLTAQFSANQTRSLNNPNAGPAPASCSSPCNLAATSLVVTPVLLMQHVSELYAYALLPTAALLLGYGYGATLIDRRRLVRTVAAVSLGLFVVGQAVATRVKAGQMARNGERATAHSPQRRLAWRVDPTPRSRSLSGPRPRRSRPALPGRAPNSQKRCGRSDAVIID